MRNTAFGLSLLAFTVLAGPAEASPSVTLYGASWCGPCRSAQAFLSSAGVPFTYVDIDQAAGRKAYRQERGASKGIPLTVIGQEKIVVASPGVLQAALERAGLKPRPVAAPAGPKSYGGFPPSWWQQQFGQLQSALATMEQRINQLRQVAADHHEKEILQKMEEDREILRASLDELEISASRAALPREYRQR